MDGRLAHAQGGRPQLRDQLAVPGDTGDVAFPRKARERRHEVRRQRPRAPHVDIEAGIARGDVNVERLAHGTDRFRNRPRRIDGAIQALGQNRTAVDRHQAMRAGGGKADLEHVMGAAPGVEYGAVAALAVGVDEVGDRHAEAGLPQRFDHEIALPSAVACEIPVLHGATAAYPEMRTDGDDALGARLADAQQPAAIRMPGDGFDFDRFAGQRAGHIDRASSAGGDAVAAMANLVDY